MPHLLDVPSEMEEAEEVVSPAYARPITRVDVPVSVAAPAARDAPTAPAAPGDLRATDILGYAEDLMRRASILTRRDASRAQDLVQDCLERALRNVHRLPPGSNLRAWLYTILANRYHDLCRIERVRAALPLSEHEAPDPEPPPSWTAVTSDDLRAALRELNPDLRATFEHREFERLSYEQIGRIMGVPVATVGTRLSRARNRLREILTARLHLEDIE